MKARAIGLIAIALLPGAGPPATTPRRMAAERRVAAAQAALRQSLAALQSVARQPASAGWLQPGSTDDLIHVRAALAGLAPTIRARAAIVRQESHRPYRAPVDGRIVVGFGDVSAAGIRSRGLTFVVRPGSRVAAPAAGIVRYAQVFRGYGGTVIVDHGAGWTSLLTGLGRLAVVPGRHVPAGAALGVAGYGASPRITLELRHHGQPLDVAPLIG